MATTTMATTQQMLNAEKYFLNENQIEWLHWRSAVHFFDIQLNAEHFLHFYCIILLYFYSLVSHLKECYRVQMFFILILSSANAFYTFFSYSSSFSRNLLTLTSIKNWLFKSEKRIKQKTHTNFISKLFYSSYILCLFNFAGVYKTSAVAVKKLKRELATLKGTSTTDDNLVRQLKLVGVEKRESRNLHSRKESNKQKGICYRRWKALEDHHTQHWNSLWWFLITTKKEYKTCFMQCKGLHKIVCSFLFSFYIFLVLDCCASVC